MEGQLVGSYRLLRKLGEGGMGVVYEGVHTQIKKRAAIKLLNAQCARHPAIAQRFVNEAKAVSIVADPGLVEVFDYGLLADGTAFIAMEYVDGITLRQRLSEAGGRLALGEALEIARQLALTLAATHARGIVHRDLKPENVMLVRDAHEPERARVKVLDFGIAKVTDEEAQTNRTETGALLGTPAYMSPEQCLGANKAGPKSDVYSLGAILFQLLTGQPPFVADGNGALLLMHMTRPAPSMRKIDGGLPLSICEQCDRMLAKSPEERPSMAEVVRAIEQFTTGRLRAYGPRRRLLRIAGALLAILVMVPLSWRVRARRPAERTSGATGTAQHPRAATVAVAEDMRSPASPTLVAAPALRPPLRAAADPPARPANKRERASERHKPAGGISTRLPEELGGTPEDEPANPRKRSEALR